jgi:hypothetical protein
MGVKDHSAPGENLDVSACRPSSSSDQMVTLDQVRRGRPGLWSSQHPGCHTCWPEEIQPTARDLNPLLRVSSNRRVTSPSHRKPGSLIEGDVDLALLYPRSGPNCGEGDCRWRIRLARPPDSWLSSPRWPPTPIGTGRWGTGTPPTDASAGFAPIRCLTACGSSSSGARIRTEVTPHESITTHAKTAA